MKLIVLSLLVGVALAELPVAPTNPPDYGLRNREVYAYRSGAYGHGRPYGNHGYYGAGHGHHGAAAGYGHGYGAPRYEVTNVEAKPAAYGYGIGHAHNSYNHGGHYGNNHRYNYGGLFQKVESHYGNTAFAYNDGASARREHIRADGTVEGSYSLVDANGNKRTVNYRAGPNGFEVDGDTGVDKATADAAAALAAQAPTAPPAEEAQLPVAPEVPEAPEVELPVAPTNPPDYGKRNEDVYKIRKGAYGHDYHGHGNYGRHNGYYGGHNYDNAYGYGTAINHGNRYYGQHY